MTTKTDPNTQKARSTASARYAFALVQLLQQIDHLEIRAKRLLECNEALSDTNGKLALARVTMETERDALLAETMSDKWFLKAQAMECDLEEARETIKKLEADRLPFAEAYAPHLNRCARERASMAAHRRSGKLAEELESAREWWMKARVLAKRGESALNPEYCSGVADGIAAALEAQRRYDSESLGGGTEKSI